VGLSALGQRVAAHGGRAHEASRSRAAREGQNPGTERAPVLRFEGTGAEVGGAMTRRAATAAETDFHERMHAAHMYGLWALASEMTRHPEPKAIPYMWKASVLDAM